MTEFWTQYGFYLWGLTTLLAIIALAWLGWNTFGPEEEAVAGLDPALAEQIGNLLETQPVLQASVGRALQYTGLEHYTDETGRPAFALAIFNARGDGFVVTNDVQSGVAAKPVNNWGEGSELSVPEQTAVQQAQAQQAQ